jgi:hypothetical protein
MDSLRKRIEDLEQAMTEMQSGMKALLIEVSKLKSDLSSASSSVQAANKRIDSLSSRVEHESVFDKPLFIQSNLTGYLSDRTDEGGYARFQGNKEAWEIMFLRRK